MWCYQPLVGLPAVGFPDSLNSSYSFAGVKLTPYNGITGYNNFYERGLDKSDPKENANKGWKTEPWTSRLAAYAENQAVTTQMTW